MHALADDTDRREFAQRSWELAVASSLLDTLWEAPPAEAQPKPLVRILDAPPTAPQGLIRTDQRPGAAARGGAPPIGVSSADRPSSGHAGGAARSEAAAAEPCAAAAVEPSEAAAAEPCAAAAVESPAQLERLALLLECFVEYVDAKDYDGSTALHTAAEDGRLSAVSLLLERRAAVDTRNPYADTPLHYAARGGCVEVARRLVAHGADVRAPNKFGVTPLECARRSGKHDVAAFLEGAVPDEGGAPAPAAVEPGR